MTAEYIGPAVRAMDWHPKRFTPGDMDGTGGDRLLGRTSLSQLEVLVREMGQNSWDARAAAMTPSFGISLRRVNWRLRELINLLLSQTAVGEKRVRASSRNLHILEIFDRGTTGLDGPVDLRANSRNGARNYEDLILKVGVPRDDGKGGGTYGFGKTAAYAYSEPGIVVYWTQCRGEDGNLEQRLIVSAFQSSYRDGDTQYTGRHWWGRRGGNMILPLTGDEAQSIGEQLFERRFLAGETGTSMLVLDPKIPTEASDALVDDGQYNRAMGSAEQLELLFAQEARSAIRRHLWPKLVEDPRTGAVPMAISLTIHGGGVDLLDSPKGALDLWGAGLTAIRMTRAGAPVTPVTPQGMHIEVREITRYRQVIGHLAYVPRVPSIEAQPLFDDLDPGRENSAVGRIMLMRGQAELVVTDEDWVDVAPPAGMDWLAVYKSADLWDAAYSEAEPPAHDMWVEGSSEPGRLARTTRINVSRWLREKLSPVAGEGEPGVVTAQVGLLARRLSVMLPVAPSEPSLGTTRAGGARSTGRRSVDGAVDIESIRLIETLPDGRQHQRAVFTVRAWATRARVSLSVSSVGEDGLTESVPVDSLEVDWREVVGVGPNSSIATLEPGARSIVDFVVPPRHAYRIALNLEEASDGDC